MGVFTGMLGGIGLHGSHPKGIVMIMYPVDQQILRLLVMYQPSTAYVYEVRFKMKCSNITYGQSHVNILEIANFSN